MFLIDVLSLLLLFFLISSVFRAFTMFRGRSGSGSDSLKATQAMSRRTAMFQGMSSQEEEEYRDSLSIGVCFSRFALKVAAADGMLTQSELNSILAFFRGANPGYVQHIQQVLSQDISNPASIDWAYNLEEARRILSKEKWKGFASILFEGLVRISMANGYVGARESEIIFSIMEDLGWSRGQTSSWFHSRGSKQQSGSSRGFAAQPGTDALKEAADILGVQVSDSLETIKKQYRTLVREHHPDRYAQMGDEMQKSATARFQAIQNAWETLEKAKSP